MTATRPFLKLREFYGMNYVSSNMACVVCSTQSLDVLQKLTENALQDVKRADRAYHLFFIF